MKKLLAAVLTVIMAVSLGACGAKEGPDTAVSNYLNAIKAQDFKTASNYGDVEYDELSGENEDEQSSAMMNSLMESLSYTIVSTEESADTATVKVNIKAIDMSLVMSDYISQAFTLAFSGIAEDELQQKMLEVFSTALENNKENLIEREVDVALTKGENGWVITMSNELADAITGGLLTVADSFSDLGE